MEGPTARVLCLPTDADIAEEAARMGIPTAELSEWAGGLGVTALKLEGVPAEISSALGKMITPSRGLVASVSRDQGDLAGHETPPYDVEGGESPLPPREGEHAGGGGVPGGIPTVHDFGGDRLSVLIVAPSPTILNAASRLESLGGDPEKAVAGEIRTALERYRGRQLGTTRCGNLTFEWGKRSYVMGIINVTPDSFSGDGLGGNVDAALAQARSFVEAGVDILDVGGESTRPGSAEVSVREEMDRVIPVVKRLAAELSTPISVDSYKLLVVQEALEAGASMINDVWGLRRTEGLGSLAAAYDVPIVLMHNRRGDTIRTDLGGHFQQVQYRDLMGEIVQGLRESVEMALAANVQWQNVIVDPGIGFGKTPEQNLVLMRRMRELTSLGRPILMGTSRKSVIGVALGAPMEERLEGTAATVAVSICNGADIVRVHDVREMVRIARMTDAIVRA